MSLKISMWLKFSLSVFAHRVQSWCYDLRLYSLHYDVQATTDAAHAVSLYNMLLKVYHQRLRHRIAWHARHTSRDCSFDFCHHWSAIVKPHHAGEAYVNLATTTALNIGGLWPRGFYWGFGPPFVFDKLRHRWFFVQPDTHASPQEIIHSISIISSGKAPPCRWGVC